METSPAGVIAIGTFEWVLVTDHPPGPSLVPVVRDGGLAGTNYSSWGRPSWRMNQLSPVLTMEMFCGVLLLKLTEFCGPSR